MATYLLAWNPKRWQWNDLTDRIEEVREQGFTIEPWSCGKSKKMRINDRIFLIRLGKEPRGIIGSGTVIKPPYERDHWDEERARSGKKQIFVEVQFEALLDPEEDEILPRDLLKNQYPFSSMHWDTNLSGIRIPDEIALELEEIWRKMVALDDLTLPEQVTESKAYLEGATQTVSVNAYERNPEARKRCIEHFGTDCNICRVNLGSIYGKVGENLIHVHHLIPLSEIGGEYEVDPVNDLRPVCPNCHSIIHRRKPAYSIEEVKQFLFQARDRLPV